MGDSTNFAGFRVLSLESRRAALMEELIRRSGGDPFVAPSVKELPCAQRDEAYEWAERLFASDFDLMVAMTASGFTLLHDIVANRYGREPFLKALRRVTIVARGPKTGGALRDMGVTAQTVVPEPNTWQEIVAAIAVRPERRLTIQEDGCPHPALVEALENLGAIVFPVSVYRWALPENPERLREAVRRIIRRECEVALFTTSIQLRHLLEVAGAMGCAAETRHALAHDIVLGSVGPVMSAALAEHGLAADISPAQPKMAALVRAAAESAAAILANKRRLAGACAVPPRLTVPHAGPMSIEKGG